MKYSNQQVSELQKMPACLHKSVVLCCPRCLELLDNSDSSLSCKSCKTQYPASHEIPILADNPDFYYAFAGMDRLQFRSLLDRIDTIGFPDAMNHFLADSSERVRNSFFRNTFDLGRVAWKFTLVIPKDAIALDLGCGAGVASIGLAPVCKKVVGYDMTLERVEFLKRWAASEGFTNVQCLCGGDADFLPFEDATFDIVVMNGVLEWVPTGRFGNPTDCQLKILREVRRVLKPSGQLYVGIENRIGYLYFLGKKEDHTGIHFLNLMPRFLASIVHKAKRKTPYRVYTYTRQGLSRLFHRSGFSHVSFYSPFPDYRHFNQIAPLDGRTNIKPPSSHWWIKSLIHKIACLPKILRHMSPTFGAVASLKQEDSSFSREIIEKLGLSPAARTPLLVSKTGTTIARAMDEKGKGIIVRLPHSPSGIRRSETNAKRLQEIHDDSTISGSLKRCVPRLVAKTVCKGQFATAETMVPGTSLDRIPEKPLDLAWSSLIKILLPWIQAGIEKGAMDSSLSRADVLRSWVLVVTKIIPESSEGKALKVFLNEIEEELNGMPGFTIPTHGDCHPGNVLVHEKNGEVTGLIDWDVEILAAPPLFDLLNFAVRTEHDGDLTKALLPLRIPASWQKDLEELVHQLTLPADFLIYLQKFYVLWRIADRLDEVILNPRRVERAMQILRWFYSVHDQHKR